MTTKFDDNAQFPQSRSEDLQDEDAEHQDLAKDLEAKSLEWLQVRARSLGIPNFAHLPKGELARHILESSAPSH